MASPVRRTHQRLIKYLMYWLEQFEEAVPGMEALSNVTAILGEDSEPQPDAYLRILPSHGGQTEDQDDYIRGAPELVVEVALSTAPLDLDQKKLAYEAAGVREYLVVLPQEIQWFIQIEGRLQPLQPGVDGIFRSHVFPGLWLDPSALMSQDCARLRAVVDQGMASQEHQEWKAQLRLPE